MYVGSRVLQIDFDFIDHELRIVTDEAESAAIKLRPISVAAFYRELTKGLEVFGWPVEINTTPTMFAVDPTDGSVIDHHVGPDLTWLTHTLDLTPAIS